MEPVCVVRRTWFSAVGVASSGEGDGEVATPLVVPFVIVFWDAGEERVDGSNVKDVGKWPVWNVLLCRRRCP
jgi:hypothetical protein